MLYCTMISVGIIDMSSNIKASGSMTTILSACRRSRVVNRVMHRCTDITTSTRNCFISTGLHQTELTTLAARYSARQGTRSTSTLRQKETFLTTFGGKIAMTTKVGAMTISAGAMTIRLVLHRNSLAVRAIFAGGNSSETVIK